MRKTIVFLLSVALASCATVAKLKGDQSAEVNGRTLAYRMNGSGLPTVVFESGLGDTKEKWSDVIHLVASAATTFTYDRAGYGASEPADDRRSAAEVVADLRALLRAAGRNPPYVLVGHSLGGLYMQYFARRYPEEVAGLVLVESTHWDDMARMRRGSPATLTAAQILVARMPAHVRAEFHGSTDAEKQVREAPPLPAIPVVVLTGTHRNILERGKYADTWYALQKETANTYHARQILADRSGHYIQSDQPELVADAISDVIARGRPNTKQ